MIYTCIHATWLLFHIIPPADSKIARGTSQRWKGNTEKMFINRRFKAGARLEQLHVELTKARNLHVFMRCSCGIWFAQAKTCSFPSCPCRQQKMSSRALGLLTQARWTPGAISCCSWCCYWCCWSMAGVRAKALRTTCSLLVLTGSSKTQSCS